MSAGEEEEEEERQRLLRRRRRAIYASESATRVSGRGGDEGPRVKRASAKGHPRGRLRCVTADKG